MLRRIAAVLSLSLSLTVPLVALRAGAAPARPSSATRASGLAYYENPQTISGVAKRFHLTIDEIAKLNGIKDPNHFNAAGLVLPETPSTRSLPRYVPWTPAPARQTCPTTVWAFRPASRQGCTDAFRATGPSGEEAYLCKSDEGNIELEIAKGNGPKAKLRLELTAWNPWGSNMIELASLDLDGDGANETLVSALGSVSNGLGEESRTLVVLKGNRETIRYDSGEFTAKTAPVRVSGRCHLASSHYEEARHPLRGRALYLVERTFDPITVRMDAGLVGRRVSDRTRFILPFDPLASAPASRGKSESIAGVTRDDTGNLGRVRLRTSASASRMLAAVGTYDTQELRFGDVRARRVFPEAFVWDGVTGRSAIYRQSPDGYRPHVLWLVN